MTEYKLTYFNIRGLAESIRYIFAYAQVPYEDNRLEKENWPALKTSFPWGQVPVLEYQGKTLAQSTAIARFLARKFSLTGADDFEAARCDELVDAFGDLRAEWRKSFMEQDPAKKEELKKTLLEVHVAKYFAKFDKIVEANGNNLLVGSKVTWADLGIAYGLDFFEKLVEPEILKSYPNLKAFKHNIESQPGVKDWLEKRPQTAM